MASTKASSVSVLIEKPNSAISAKLPINDTGMVTSGMIDARMVRKNTKITSATSTTASKIVVNTALIERSMNTELSLATSISTPAGKLALILGIISRTPADKSSGFAVALRITPSVMASLPFKRVAVRSDAGPWRTWATSPMRTGWPLTVRITTWANSEGRCKSVAVVTLNSRWRLSMRPAGTSTFERRRASSTS